MTERPAPPPGGSSDRAVVGRRVAFSLMLLGVLAALAAPSLSEVAGAALLVGAAAAWLATVRCRRCGGRLFWHRLGFNPLRERCGGCGSPLATAAG